MDNSTIKILIVKGLGKVHKGKNLKLIFKKVIKRAWEDDIFSLASQLAYNLLLAFFPFTIFLLTLVGYSSIKSSDIMGVLKEVIPKDAFTLVNKTVLEIVNTQSGSLLSISIILTIWSASAGVNAVIKGLNKAYNEKDCRNIVIVQLVSILFTLILAIVIILSVFILVLGEVNGYLIVKWFGYSAYFHVLWNIMRFVLIAIIMIFIFAGLYIYAPCKRHSFKEVLPGAVFASAGWVLASLCFSFYVNNFGNYSNIYGSLGAVIILMTWLLISSIIVILGGEINSVLMVNIT